jgi:hypothetical protein
MVGDPRFEAVVELVGWWSARKSGILFGRKSDRRAFLHGIDFRRLCNRFESEAGLGCFFFEKLANPSLLLLLFG